MNKRSRFRRRFFPKFVTVVILVTIISAFVIHARSASLDANVSNADTNEPKSAEIDQKVAEIMTNMTVEDKIRQMFIIEMRGWMTKSATNEIKGETLELVNFTELTDTTPDDTPGEIDSPHDFFSTYHYGGIIMFDENIDSVEQITTLNSNLQKLNAETGGLPLFIAVDQEGGLVNRLPGTLFPGNMAIAATGDIKSASTAGWNIGDELSLTGFNVDFAPDADVNTNPDNPVIGVRSFGDDPGKVADYAVAFAEGLENANVASCAKHFPGHGDTATDSHFDLPVIDRSLAELETAELVPFRSLIEHGVDMIMTAHILLPEIESDKLPATLSDDVITGLLRNKLNYDGVVITDGIQMAAVQDNFTPREVAKLAINAGVDILLAPYNITSQDAVRAQERLVADIAAMVNAGEIPATRIDESVRRILKLKIEKGLLDNNYLNPNLDYELLEVKLRVRAASHLAAESDIAEDAVTIYRGSDLLPLNRNSRILVAPASIRQGELIKHIFAETDVQINLIDPDTNTAQSENLDADLLIITSCDMDGNNSAEVEKNNALIALAQRKGIPSIVISTGLPYDVVDYPDADVVLAVYNPAIGFAGGPYTENIPAAFRVLFGVATSPKAGQGSFPVQVGQ